MRDLGDMKILNHYGYMTKKLTNGINECRRYVPTCGLYLSLRSPVLLPEKTNHYPLHQQQRQSPFLIHLQSFLNVTILARYRNLTHVSILYVLQFGSRKSLIRISLLNLIDKIQGESLC